MRTLAQLGVIAAATCLTALAHAEGPRQAEVDGRLANQNARINEKVANGEMSRHEAHQLKRQDRAIHREKNAMAAANGGYITRLQQRQLNHQENQVSREIGR